MNKEEQELWFWNIVESCGWGTKTVDYNQIKKDLIKNLTLQESRRFFKVFSEKEQELSIALFKHIKNLGDDSYSDLISHIIGLGKKTYYQTLYSPDLGKERALKYDFVESFRYCFPIITDYD